MANHIDEAKQRLQKAITDLDVEEKKLRRTLEHLSGKRRGPGRPRKRG